MSERVCYRYRTVALCGPWRRQPETAHRDAIGAGQVRPDGAEVTWLVEGEIEASYCDKGGACGGQYPAEDPDSESGPATAARRSSAPTVSPPPARS